MQKLTKTLKTKLKGAKRIAVLGVGSDLRADDAAGQIVAMAVESACRKKCFHPQVEFFFGATAPENLTGEVKKFKPTHLIIIDSAELGKRPGAIRLLDPRQIGGVSFSTHRLPTKVMVDYLRKSIGCKAVIIGIQPKSLTFGKSLSKEVKKTIAELSASLKEAFLGE